MDTRYWLTIEGGDRRGTKFAIPAAGCLLGRDAACALQLPEPSISNKHARLTVEEHGVRVTDLESRNGTRVNGERVTEHLLAHGDRLSLGKLHLQLIDRRVTGGESSEDDTLVSGAAPAGAADQLMHADSARFKKARGLSPIIGLVLLVALAAGGYYASQVLGQSSGEPTRREPVVATPGDLLADGSLEGSEAIQAWVPEQPGSLELSSSYRHRGEQGLGAELGVGETLELRSPWCSIRAGRAVAASLFYESDSGVELALSWEFKSSRDATRQLEVLGELLPASAEFREVESLEALLPGFDRARLVLRASAANAGRFALDDVALTERDREDQRVQRFEEFELFAHGVGPSSLSLVRIDRVAASRLSFFEGVTPLRIEASATATGWTLRPRASAPGARFGFLVSDDLAELGLATLHRGASSPEGEIRGGRRRLSTAATTAEVSGFLAGEGTLLVRFGFDPPVELQSERTERGWQITTGPLEGAVELQLSFRDERNRASDLADLARRAERADEPSRSLGLWAELLQDVPFDAALVAEAETSRARQLRAGLDQVELVRADFARARFFNLPEIYRRNAARTRELRERYAGSEVEEEAARLETEITAALAGHKNDAEAVERERLAGVAAALDQLGAEQLAEYVRERAEPSETGGGTH